MPRPELYPVKKVIGFGEKMLEAIDKWRRRQTPIPSVSDAIRRLVDLGLLSSQMLGSTAARAEKAAGKAIDQALAQSGQPDVVKAERKRRLTKMPRELK
jgi:hypothetical protein